MAEQELRNDDFEVAGDDLDIHNYPCDCPEPCFGLKKKKKKQVHANLNDDLEFAGEEDCLNDVVGKEGEGYYEYEELLDKVFDKHNELNPDFVVGQTTVLPTPQVLRQINKTVLVNFMDLCGMMHREPDHVMSFLLAELCTTASLDGNQRLVVKGRFVPNNFEGILRRYMNDYVLCNDCKSSYSILSKENRLFFLTCEQCGARRSVAPIKQGFVATL